MDSNCSLFLICLNNCLANWSHFKVFSLQCSSQFGVSVSKQRLASFQGILSFVLLLYQFFILLLQCHLLCSLLFLLLLVSSCLFGTLLHFKLWLFSLPSCHVCSMRVSSLVIGGFAVISLFGSYNLIASCVTWIPIMLSSDILVLSFDTTLLLFDSPHSTSAFPRASAALTTVWSAGYLSFPITPINSKTLLQKWSSIYQSCFGIQYYVAEDPHRRRCPHWRSLSRTAVPPLQ